MEGPAILALITVFGVGLASGGALTWFSNRGAGAPPPVTGDVSVQIGKALSAFLSGHLASQGAGNDVAVQSVQTGLADLSTRLQALVSILKQRQPGG